MQEKASPESTVCRAEPPHRSTKKEWRKSGARHGSTTFGICSVVERFPLLPSRVSSRENHCIGKVPTRGIAEKMLTRGSSSRVEVASRDSDARRHCHATADEGGGEERENTFPLATRRSPSSLRSRPNVPSPTSSAIVPCSLPLITSDIKNRVVAQLAKKLHVIVNRRLQEREEVEQEEKKAVVWVPKPTTAIGGTLAECVDEGTGKGAAPLSPLSQGLHVPAVGVNQAPFSCFTSPPPPLSSTSFSSPSIGAVANREESRKMSPHEINDKQTVLRALPLEELMKEAFPEWKDPRWRQIATTGLVSPPALSRRTTTTTTVIADTDEKNEEKGVGRRDIMKFFSAGSIPFPSDKKSIDVKSEDGTGAVQPALSLFEPVCSSSPDFMSLALLSKRDALRTTTISGTSTVPGVLEEKNKRVHMASPSEGQKEEKSGQSAQQWGGERSVCYPSAHLLESDGVVEPTSAIRGMHRNAEGEDMGVKAYLTWLTHRFGSETTKPLAWSAGAAFSTSVGGIKDGNGDGGARRGGGSRTTPPASSWEKNSLSPMVVHSIQLNDEHDAKEENESVSGPAGSGTRIPTDASHSPADIISKMLRDAQQELQEQEKQRVGLVRVQRLRANPNFNRGVFAWLPVYQGRSGHWFGYTMDKLEGERQRVLTACRRAILDGPIQHWLGSFFSPSSGRSETSSQRMESREGGSSSSTGSDGEGRKNGSRRGGGRERKKEGVEMGSVEAGRQARHAGSDEMRSATPVSGVVVEEEEEKEGVKNSSRYPTAPSSSSSRTRRLESTVRGAPFAVFELSRKDPTDFSANVNAGWVEEDVMFSHRACRNAQKSRFQLSHYPCQEDWDGEKFHTLISSLSEIIDAKYGKNLTVEEKEEAKKRLRQARERMRLKSTLYTGRARGKIGQRRLGSGGGSVSQSKKKKTSSEDLLGRNKVDRTRIKGDVPPVSNDTLENHEWLEGDLRSRDASTSPQEHIPRSVFSPSLLSGKGGVATRTHRVAELISPSSDSGEESEGRRGGRRDHHHPHRHRSRGKGSPLSTSDNAFTGTISSLVSSGGGGFSARRTLREHPSRDGREGSNVLFTSVKDEEVARSFSMLSIHDRDHRHSGRVDDKRREKSGATTMRGSKEREGRMDDGARANLLLARFSDGKKNDGLRREAKSMLTHLDQLGLSALSLSAKASKNSLADSLSSFHGRKEMHGSKHGSELSSLALSLGSILPPEGFSVDETELIARFKKEVEKEQEEMMKELRRLRKDVEKQRKALHHFQYDVQFLSSGTNEMTADEYAVELLRDVKEYAKTYHLSLYELTVDGDGEAPESSGRPETDDFVMQMSSDANSSGGGREKDRSRLTTIHHSFLDHFRGGRNTREKKSVACQVTEEDLGVVEGSVQLATEQLEDLMFHERSLMDSIRLATVAVANVMSFHASLELESTCKQCFFLLDRPRTLWPCGHTFCHQCLMEMCNEHEEITCAECGSICEVGYTPNYAIEQVAHYQVVQEAVEDLKLRRKKTTIEGVLRNILHDLLNSQKNISSTPKT